MCKYEIVMQTRYKMAIQTINPATEEIIRTFEPLTDFEIDTKLELANSAFQKYKRTSFLERKNCLSETAELLKKNDKKYAQIITLEMGKLLKEAIAEVNKCALVCRYYAENAEKFLQPQKIKTEAENSYVTYQPLGPILAVMPWNFPFWQVFRFAAPNLMAGNVALLKHSSNVPQCALSLQDIFLESGFPEGVFQTLLVSSNKVEKIISDTRVKAGTLTGSELAGRSFATNLAKVLKKTVLELGGSDPFIILQSADLEKAVSTALTARMINNGQSCIAAKRFIIEETVYDIFLEKLLVKYKNLKIGDPNLQETELGPLATQSILQEIDAQVRSCIEKGAKVMIGGKPLEGTGYFYPPTLLTDLPKDSLAYKEEFFGPVGLVFKVKNLQEAINIANDSPFGLGASAWTKDEQEIKELSSELEFGSVFINGMVKSDPRLPFGGIKNSGYGRELAREGILEFMNTKTIVQDYI